MSAASGLGPLSVCVRPRWLVVDLGAPHTVVSWAIVNGARHETDLVVWHEVRNDELGVDEDPRALLLARMRAESLGRAVGLLTSRQVARFVARRVEAQGFAADVVVTVGLGNALRAGDPTSSARVGTINLLCRTSAALSAEAALEVMALVAEARTVALLEARVPSLVSGRPASGTGTDCVAVAWPTNGRAARYAGKHTPLGHVVGAAVLAAVRAGVEEWLAERAAAT